MCCCHLHNYLSNRNQAFYIRRGDMDYENTNNGTFEDGSWRNEQQITLQLQRSIKGNSTVDAKNIRDDFRKYFNPPAGLVS